MTLGAIMVIIMLLGQQTSYSSAYKSYGYGKCFDICMRDCRAAYFGYGKTWCHILCALTSSYHCKDGRVSITENKDTYCQLGCSYSTCAAKPNLGQEEAKGCVNSCFKTCTKKH
ncbi:hypothetical protein MKW94_005966 [Papaver nudicaule]|uniref:Thionin-like protein 2 n=1 Tax=Papaver nudicaule TaxID=74823 RepID=A0AA42B214_PAPNU|nr:hypothetical protein [Papaver nudicaule]